MRDEAGGLTERRRGREEWLNDRGRKRQQEGERKDEEARKMEGTLL